MHLTSLADPETRLDEQSTSGGYTVHVARTVSEVEALRPLWTKLQWHPNSDLDHYLAVVHSTPKVVRPHVSVIRRDGAPQSILVARLEKTALQLTLGYRALYQPMVRSITVIYQGVLGDDSRSHATVFAQALRKSLSDGEADVVWFNSLRKDSPLYCASQAASGAMLKDYFPTQNLHWRVHLPGTYEEFLRRLSSNTRHNLRRYSSRLLKTLGRDVAVRCYRQGCDLGRILNDSEVVASKTYQRGLAVGFVNDARTRLLTSMALDREMLRAYVLYIGAVPCAFWNGLLYKKSFFTVTTGMDPAYRELRLGTFLLTKVFEDMCQEGGAERVDFGFGDAQYKRDFCDESWQEVSFYMFAPTLHGLALNLLRTPPMLVDRLGRKALERTKLLQRVKRSWRNMLRSREGSQPSQEAKP